MPSGDPGTAVPGCAAWTPPSTGDGDHTRRLPSAARLCECRPFAFPFASSREAPRVRATTYRGASPLRVRQAGSQCSGWKARATFIRAHSCSFVVPNHPFCVSLRVFASSREAHPARVTTYRKASALRGSNRRITVLGLESPSYIHSCRFVFIRGSKSPLLNFPSRLRVFA